MYFLQMITQGYFLKFSTYLSKKAPKGKASWISKRFSLAPWAQLLLRNVLLHGLETAATWCTSEFHPGPLGPLPTSPFALNLLCGQRWFPWISVFSGDGIRSGPLWGTLLELKVSDLLFLALPLLSSGECRRPCKWILFTGQVVSPLSSKIQ